MPQEIRHIRFSEHEVRGIVLGLLKSRGDGNAMKGANLTVSETENAGAVVELRYGDPDHGFPGRRVLILSNRDTLSAAILYCRSNHVPLPIQAAKHLQLVQGHLTLVVSSVSTV